METSDNEFEKETEKFFDEAQSYLSENSTEIELLQGKIQHLTHKIEKIELLLYKAKRLIMFMKPTNSYSEQRIQKTIVNLNEVLH
tara:strand:+ start:310 stop:564 length:255 start_codon:yes stop_codon:yes gene_type:complete